MIKRDPYINKTLFSEYLIQKKIGKGSFGTVYQGIIISNKQKIAVKLEKREKNDSGLLESEACRLYLVQGEGIPKIICYGNNETHNILIQELLGHSLEELFNTCKRKFTLKTVCSIGIEMIKRIKFIHSKYHIHRDIKPDNFMTGIEKNDDKIYIIDFGLAKKYYSSSKKHHIKFRTGKNLIGTARYCGRNAHRGYEQGRRDDIESIGYVLMYFLNGVLPWQGIKVMKGEEHFERIAEKKYNTSFEELTKGNPEEFLLYFKHCDSLKFEDEPNYDYLIDLFKTVINKYCLDCLYDYDWKKNTIPDLSAIKDKEENNNNKDISLLVHNNVSAIESKGEGKEEEKENNIKMKKDIYIGEEDNNINHKNLRRNKSTIQLNNHIYNKKYNSKNLEENNDIIEINQKKVNKERNNNNNNIIILNNSIVPQVQNINININFNNNSKQSLNKEKKFNKSDINISEELFHNLYNNEKNEYHHNKINNYNNQNFFKKKNIKKEYFFSYDESMDDMVKSNYNSLKDTKNNNEEENNLDCKQLSRFQQPKKLENIFTEEDIKIEELNDINENEINQIKMINNSKNIIHENNIFNSNHINIKTHQEKTGHKYEHNHLHGQPNNKSVIHLIDHSKNSKNKDFNYIYQDNSITIGKNKELNNNLNNTDNKEDKNTNYDNENNESKRNRRNRVKSVDNKIRKNDLGCHCIII